MLIAGELRALGDLRGAERLLAQVLLTKSEPTRADALAERARLRAAAAPRAEALADLREADAIYARLKLDFNRIDTSSALALALLAAGDVQRRSRRRGHRGRDRNPHPREFRESRAARALPVGELCALRGAHRSRSRRRTAAGSGGDLEGVSRCRSDPRPLAGRPARALRAHDRIMPRDAEADRLRERMTALQVDLERRMRKARTDDAEVHETRRLIDEVSARLEARVLRQRGVAVEPASSRIAESLEAVQAALPADTAVLAYFVGDQRSHGWLLTRSELRHSVLPGRRELGRTSSTLSSNDSATARRHLTIAAFAPLLGNLLNGVNARRLLVLPDGPLEWPAVRRAAACRTGARANC